MALLQFDSSAAMTAGEKRAFARRVRSLYADHMDTGTDHVAVSIHERTDSELSIGRADPDQPRLVLDAEIRQGREFERKRSFALAVMDLANDAWAIPDPNMKVVFTEHTGEDVMGVDRVDSDRSEDESN